MKLLTLMYIADAYKLTARLVYGATVATLVLCLSFLLQSASATGSVASTAPDPTTYRHVPSVAQVATSAINVQRKQQADLAAAAAVTTWPIHGTVTTEFGGSHHGIDIASMRPVGTARVAAFKVGTVVVPPGQVGGLGTVVAIDNGNGLISYYGHLSATAVSVGQQVAAGDSIGTEGSTGHSTGPHVHFELRLNGQPVNPRNYLSGNP